jgi:hypothetical protein
MAAFAPIRIIFSAFSVLLLTTVTECPAAINFSASGLLMFPSDPNTTYFIAFDLIVHELKR